MGFKKRADLNSPLYKVFDESTGIQKERKGEFLNSL
jgi:hypothetical protein